MTVSPSSSNNSNEGISESDQHVIERRGYQEWTNKLPDGKIKRTVSKLFTNEDNQQIHKTLGILSLISFIYRYFVVAPQTGNLGFEGTWFDHATMALHILLSTSSLLFHVLSMRILSRPMIIWEEYRLHAIVFSTRCLSVYLFGYFKPFQDSPYERIALAVLVLAHHVAADEITRRYGPKDQSSTTVRVKDNNNTLITSFLRFYAFYQFSALACHLVPNARLMDLGFNTFIAIQSSAFLMTLYRKSIITEYSHAFWYTFCLILSLWQIFRDCGSTLFFIKLFTAFFLRTKFGVNKYVLWTAYVLLSFPQVDNTIKSYYYMQTNRDLDSELHYAGSLVAQSLFSFSLKEL